MVAQFRPNRFKEFIGNEETKEKLALLTRVCRREKIALPHTILYGPPGTGKTTLANIIAKEYKAELITITGGSIRDQETLYFLLEDIQARQQKKKPVVLFIDEVHDLGAGETPESCWLPIFENYTFHSTLMGEILVDPKTGRQLRIVSSELALEPFTIIGATTNAESLSKPLRDRFKVNCYMEDYTPAEMGKIIKQYANQSGYKIEPSLVKIVADRTRCNPRTAVNLLDMAVFRTKNTSRSKTINKKAVAEEVRCQKLDQMGLFEQDRVILRILEANPKGLGMGRLANMILIKPKAFTELYEGYLTKRNLITACSRGRTITTEGVKHLANSKLTI